MNGRLAASTTAILALSAVMLMIGSPSLMGQAQGYVPPRTASGQPDLQGVWQVLNSAAWNIEDHSPSLGVPGGYGVVEGGSLPYLPAALAKRKENFAKRSTDDPEVSCDLPGVPRATYLPYPIQIAQYPDAVMIFHEYLTIQRQIWLAGPHPDPEVNEYWMGDSRGRWEGNSLVVDVRNFNDRTWFDRAGNFHSDALHVVERFTPTDRDHLNYEVTVEDPKVFSRPWKMSMPLYRRQEKNIRLLEYECYSYMEEEANKGNLKLPWTHFGFEGTPQK